MGKRMFDGGEGFWPEEAPSTPRSVVTHEKRVPWERPGGTTFHRRNGLTSAPATVQVTAVTPPPVLQAGRFAILAG